MEETERYEPLSPAEVAALSNKSHTARTIVILVAIGFKGIAAWGVWSTSWANITIFIGGLLVLWFVLRGQLASLTGLKSAAHFQTASEY